MKKKVFGRKFSRDRGSRTALFRSLVKAMVERGKIVTTKAKAKAVQPMIEKLVSASKTKDVAVIRRTFGYLGNDKQTVSLLFGKVGEVFAKRKGGYTRIITLPRRKGDNAQMARIEWVEKVEIEEKKKNNKKTKKVEKTEPEKKTLKSRVSKLISSKKK